MFLKIISIENLDFHNTWLSGIEKIKRLSLFDKYMTIFWLIGPFIYLIERDPADLWLTLIGITFLFKSFKNNNWAWANQSWFKFTLLFWIYSMFSGLLGYDPIYSLTKSFTWIRFPLYAVAAQSWIAKDRDIRMMMLVSLLAGMLLMSVILLAEIIISPKLRLIWPYQDAMTGAYMTKLCMPISLIVFIVATSKFSKKHFLYLFISISEVLLTISTGERMHTILKIVSNVTANIFYKPRYFLLIISMCLMAISITSIFLLNNSMKLRFNELTTASPLVNISSVNNSYWGAWRGGIQLGLNYPIFGAGPEANRLLCSSLKESDAAFLPGKNFCGNHPHNYYIQLFSETGLIGLILGILMFSSIIYSCYNVRKLNQDCHMGMTSFIIPLSIFFPIQQFGNFFGQWGNLFIWFAIGFAICQIQNDKKSH
jgi:O-antigen ligase